MCELICSCDPLIGLQTRRQTNQQSGSNLQGCLIFTTPHLLQIYIEPRIQSQSHDAKQQLMGAVISWQRWSKLNCGKCHHIYILMRMNSSTLPASLQRLMGPRVITPEFIWRQTSPLILISPEHVHQVIRRVLTCTLNWTRMDANGLCDLNMWTWTQLYIYHLWFWRQTCPHEHWDRQISGHFTSV